MKIAVLGAGAIGSTFAFQLSRAGHDVTAIARGVRLEQLERARAIERADGQRAAVAVAASLDTAIEWDLVLVSVLATQLDAVMPALRASAARTVMFMFNTFESIEPLREAVGPSRFSFGFPMGIFTLLIDGVIHPQIRAGTTVDDLRWATLFGEAGIASVVEADMQAWLRSHAALVAPLMSAGVLARARADARGAVTWAEATLHATALQAGFAIVRSLGHAPRPASLGHLARLPRAVLASMLWTFSRTAMGRDLGALGAAEPRMLIDMMAAASPTLAAPLVAIRP